MRSNTARAGMTGAVAITVLSGSLIATHGAAAAPETPVRAASQSLLPAKVMANLTAALDAAGVQRHSAATCGDTNFTVWVKTHTRGWSATDRKEAQQLATLAEVDALYYPSSRTAIGNRGQYTGAMNREMGKLRGFWDVKTKVALGGLHPGVLTSKTRLTRMLVEMGGASRREAAAEAAGIVKVAHQPKFANGRHPMFTLNAFSAPAIVYKGHRTSARIIMGDGILQAMSDLGWKNTAPQEILAHEYGHQATFANGTTQSPRATGTSAQTQYAELLADAYSGYFLHHRKGDKFGWKAMNTYLQVAYATGDCAFTNLSHHGTPNQRMAAATWGANVADHDGSSVRSTKRFASSFAGAYRRIAMH